MSFEQMSYPSIGLQLHGPQHLLQELAAFAGGANRVSAWVDCSNKSKVFGAAFSDQAGTLLVQFSADGVNVDHEETILVAAEAKTSGFVIDVVLPLVRLSYTNGAAPSTATRINLYARGVS